MKKFIAIYNYEDGNRWYWALQESGTAAQVEHNDYSSEDICREEIQNLQENNKLPDCNVISGGVREPHSKYPRRIRR